MRISARLLAIEGGSFGNARDLSGCLVDVVQFVRTD